jgi:chromosomal replication initiation ATPase DnaA
MAITLTNDWLPALPASPSCNPPSRKSSLAPLWLREEKRRPRWRQNIPRQGDGIPRELAETILALCRGELDWPLFLHGPVGVGKSCAALHVCDCIRGSVYYTLSEFLRESAQCNRGELDGLWEGVDRATLLVVDEIGVRSQVSEAAFEAVRDLADAREYRPTIYVSNVEPSAIADIFDARVLSRMACGTIVKLEGDDRRFRDG